MRRKTRSKIDPGAFRTEVPAKNVPKMHLGACPARFWRGLGASRASLGRLLGVLGRLLGALGCLLGASGVPLGRSWGTLGRILALMDAPGLDFGRFGGGPGWVWGGFEGIFLQDFCMQPLDLHDALIAAGNFGFSFPPAARRYVRSTSVAERARYKVTVLRCIPQKHSQDFRPRIHAKMPGPHPVILPPRAAQTAKPA